jgi:hypothetical protein
MELTLYSKIEIQAAAKSPSEEVLTELVSKACIPSNRTSEESLASISFLLHF